MRKKAKARLLIALCAVFIFAISFYLLAPAIFGDTVYPLKYADFIKKYSTKYNIDPTLVAAVIFQESRFNPGAVSPAGAQGLMQFMPGTAATMARETGRIPYNIFDAETSVEFGAAHLRDLLVKYNGNVDAALVAYNTGTGSADKIIRAGFLGRLSNQGVGGYVRRVKNYQTVYQMMYAEELGVTPPLVVEDQSERSKLRSFIIAQIFSNVLSGWD